MNKLKHIVAIVSTLYMITVSTVAIAEDPVLDEIKISHFNGKPIIQINFYRPMQYLSHTPLHEGNVLEVELKSTGPTTEDPMLPEPPERENLTWTPTSDIPLREVEYLEDNHEHTVTLFFETPVKYTVRNGTNYYSLIVTIIPQSTPDAEPLDLTGEEISSEAFPPLTPEQEKTRKSSMSEARKALLEGKYLEAIAYYRRVLRLPPNISQKRALELTGLAYEKGGQLKRAQNEYERYIQLYPKGDDAVRVRQRLFAITTAGQTPTELRESKRTQISRWTNFGSLAQTFRYSGSHYDGQSSSVDVKALDSSILHSARYRDDEKTINTRISGGYNYDGIDSTASSSSISNLYGEIIYRDTALSAKVGRQSRNKGGVLGRFDGVYLGKGLSNGQMVTLTTGYPVNSQKDGVITSKKLISVGYEWNDFIADWDLSTYLAQQNNEVMTDRQAIGFDVSHITKESVLFGMVDYDLLFSEFNLLSLIGNISTTDGTNYNFSFDQRASVWNFTSNASADTGSGTITSLSQLRNTFTEKQIIEMANDRSAVASTASLGINKSLNEKYQINADIVATKTTATTPSYGIVAIPATDTEIYANGMLIVNEMWWKEDITIFGLRHSIGTNSSTTSITTNTRIPWNSVWKFNPRIRFDLRDYNNDTLVNTEWKIFPTFNMTYKYSKKVNLEFDAGLSLTNRSLIAGGSEKDTYYYVSSGYRMEF